MTLGFNAYIQYPYSILQDLRFTCSTCGFAEYPAFGRVTVCARFSKGTVPLFYHNPANDLTREYSRAQACRHYPVVFLVGHLFEGPDPECTC